MRRTIILLCAALTIAGCKKDYNNNEEGGDHSIYGRYTGTFHRSGMDTSNVQISFLSNNHFEGSGERSLYPAICGGDFTFDGNTLSVNDTCTWAANFDWTLIFDGTYNVSFTGENSLRLWRTSGTIRDEYLLRKFVR